jgi:hypothetical protein
VQTGRVEGSVDRACGRQCRQGVWKAQQADSTDRTNAKHSRRCISLNSAVDRQSVQKTVFRKAALICRQVVRTGHVNTTSHVGKDEGKGKLTKFEDSSKDIYFRTG